MYRNDEAEKLRGYSRALVVLDGKRLLGRLAVAYCAELSARLGRSLLLTGNRYPLQKKEAPARKSPAPLGIRPFRHGGLPARGAGGNPYRDVLGLPREP
jgi:hypothetical protein